MSRRVNARVVSPKFRFPARLGLTRLHYMAAGPAAQRHMRVASRITRDPRAAAATWPVVSDAKSPRDTHHPQRQSPIRVATVRIRAYGFIPETCKNLLKLRTVASRLRRQVTS